MNQGTLIASVVLGAIGVGYLVYGRRQRRVAPFLAGLGLCAVPYAFDSVLALLASAAALLALPFVLRF